MVLSKQMTNCLIPICNNQGVIRIHVNEARNLINGDVSFTAAGRRPDPYCVLQRK